MSKRMFSKEKCNVQYLTHAIGHLCKFAMEQKHLSLNLNQSRWILRISFDQTNLSFTPLWLFLPIKSVVIYWRVHERNYEYTYNMANIQS